MKYKTVSTSVAMELDKTDWTKIAKGAAIAFAAAVLVNIGTYLTAGTLDWKVIIAASISVGINAAYKYFKDNTI